MARSFVFLNPLSPGPDFSSLCRAPEPFSASLGSFRLPSLVELIWKRTIFITFSYRPLSLCGIAPLLTPPSHSPCSLSLSPSLPLSGVFSSEAFRDNNRLKLVHSLSMRYDLNDTTFYHTILSKETTGFKNPGCCTFRNLTKFVPSFVKKKSIILINSIRIISIGKL